MDIFNTHIKIYYMEEIRNMFTRYGKYAEIYGKYSKLVAFQVFSIYFFMRKICGPHILPKKCGKYVAILLILI